METDSLYSYLRIRQTMRLILEAILSTSRGKEEYSFMLLS